MTTVTSHFRSLFVSNLKIFHTFDLIYNIVCFCKKHDCITFNELSTQFPWFTGWFWPIRFDIATVPYGNLLQSGLTLQLFPMERQTRLAIIILLIIIILIRERRTGKRRRRYLFIEGNMYRHTQETHML